MKRTSADTLPFSTEHMMSLWTAQIADPEWTNEMYGMETEMERLVSWKMDGFAHDS